MENFAVKIDGKEYWISRSVAVCCFIFKIKDDELYALIERRGSGAADEQGKLAAVSGYLSYNETLTQAVVREIFEETGFKAKEERLQFMKINSDPSEAHQNVTIHYVYFAKKNEDFDLDRAEGGEENEVSEVKWFKVGDLGKKNNVVTLYANVYDIMAEDWAFNHDKLLIEHLSKFFKLAYKKDETEKEEKDK